MYPLRFREIIRSYKFGERWIAEAFPDKKLPSTGIIAETWEVCCLNGDCSIVTNGEFSGKNISELIATQGCNLLGHRIVQQFGLNFPLLIKLLDVTHTLGAHVHPNAIQARKIGRGNTGKTEAWYMLDVKKDAKIYCGNRKGVTITDVVKAVQTETVQSCMKEYPVQKGDAFILYTGTMHYSPGGLLFYEIMENSDAGLPLINPPQTCPVEQKERHFNAIKEIVRIEDDADVRTFPVVIQEGQNRRIFLFACTHFAVERLELIQPYRLISDESCFYVLTLISGICHVETNNYSETLKPGNSCLLPACLKEVNLIPEGMVSILKAYVPELITDIIKPLRAAGVPDKQIALLGGCSQLNPLPALLLSV